ncbi:MAG TPA: hypothetical protein VMS76_16750 [Planctomycetota bacterium]|nr:hypothetical protein [Planctomycetota bacterium]
MFGERVPSSLLAGLLIGAIPAWASAQVITVTTTEDVVDFGGGQQVANLPGPDGVVSFREACTAANNTPGPQTIAFAIPNAPPNEWSGGVAILFMDFNSFQLSDDDTTVDFTTQTAFTGNTNPNGNEVGIRTAPITSAPAINVSGDRCVVKGLDRVSYCGYGVRLSGNDNRVIGCTISGPLYAGVYISGGFGGLPARNNVVGGTNPGEGNTLSSGNDGVRIDAPADDNVVIGNVLTGSFNGAAVRGSTYSSFPNNNRIGGPTPAERNIIAGAGKYGQEGFPDGTQVKVEHANGTIIEGNYIGTTAAGTAPHPSQRGPVGVSVIDSTGTIVRANVISGIRVMGVNHYAGQLFGDGIRVTTINGPTASTTIENNLIGTDPSGQAPVPNLYGIRVVPFIASHATTGTLVSTNTVAFNERAGIVVANPVSGVRIRQNSISSNGQLGIDLLPPGGGSGVTLNDPLDGDSGGNGLQNFPVLASATLESGGIHIAGTLNSSPNANFTIEVFASPGCDPSGFGEGQVFLGATGVTTDAAGDADIDVQLASTAPAGWLVTATATAEPQGSTSEFSACVALSENGVTSYCTAGTTTNGCTANMGATGTPSVSASSGFQIEVSDVEGQRLGIFFYGLSGRSNLPWGASSSFLCVNPPTQRLPVLSTGGTLGTCDGAASLDWLAFIAGPGTALGEPFSPGTVVNAQFWFRDPQSPTASMLSDGLEFTTVP